MADKRIRDLGAVNPAKLTGAALFEVEDSDGNTKKATGAQVNAKYGAGILSQSFSLTAAQVGDLHNTPVTFSPAAPGAGFWLVPLAINGVMGTPSNASGRWGDSMKLGRFAGLLPLASLDIAQATGVKSVSLGALTSGVPIAATALDNQQLQFFATTDLRNGGIATATVNAGGTGYAVNDTGIVDVGNQDATYQVLTVDGGGAVLTFAITAAGVFYAVVNGAATATGGGQPGIGTGFAVDILTVFLGGAVSGRIYYTIEPV